MKIRTGFVSNSSSSSFIIVFPKHVGGVNEMGKLLYRGEWDEPDALHDGDHDISRKLIATTVYDDYCKAKKTPREVQDQDILSDLSEKHYIHAWSHEQLLDELIHNYPDSQMLDFATKKFEIRDKLNNMGEKGRKTKAGKKLMEAESVIYGQESARMNVLAQEEYNKLLKIHKEYIILRLEYSDNEGALGFQGIEHGDVFKNLVNQRISHH